jgi:glyoxylate/succinic semialdehyde reductase
MQIMGTMMASFAEGLALAKRAGLSQEDLLEASGLGAIAAPMFAMKVHGRPGTLTMQRSRCFGMPHCLCAVHVCLAQAGACKGRGRQHLVDLQGPSMLKGEYPTAFPLKHQQKDLRLVLELAESTSQPLPVAAAANSLFEQVATVSNRPTTCWADEMTCVCHRLTCN